MARSAILGWFVLIVCNLKRLVRIVAGRAILLCLALHVRFVALEALGNEAVFWMAPGTSDFRMETLIGPQVFTFILMTCHTCIRDFFGKRDNKRCVWIPVAFETVFKLKMRLAGVAFATLRYVVRDFRWMALMTVNTRDLGLMACTVLCDVLWFLIVAFYTIRRAKHWFSLRSGAFFFL